MTMHQQACSGNKVVKCACGLLVRVRNWEDHWIGCRFGSAGPATEEDVALLTAHEKQYVEYLEHCRKQTDEDLERRRNRIAGIERPMKPQEGRSK